MEDRLRHLMKEAGLSKYTDAVLASEMNSIRVYTHPISDESELEIGASKIGGMPDLPPDVEWPFYTHCHYAFNQEIDTPPLSFIAQFNMSELEPYDTDNLLPQTGMLYFFYDAIDQPGVLMTPEPNGFKVIYHDGSLSGLRRVPYPDELIRDGRFPAHSVTFNTERSFPRSDSVYLDAMGMSMEEQHKYDDLLDQVLTYPEHMGKRPHMVLDEGIHRLLGHPDRFQNDVFLRSVVGPTGLSELLWDDPSDHSAIWEDPATLEKAFDWRLLLQIGSTARFGVPAEVGSDLDAKSAYWESKNLLPEMIWGDDGYLHFCIQKEDLAARDFSKAWQVGECEA